MAVGDVVGQTGSVFTFQPAGTTAFMVSNVFADNTGAWHVGGGGIATSLIAVGASGSNSSQDKISYQNWQPMARTFLNNANFIEFGGSGSKGFTGIQIA